MLLLDHRRRGGPRGLGRSGFDDDDPSVNFLGKMSGDFLATAGTIILTAALSYFLGNRSAKWKVLSEQRARATNRFVTLIGETVSVMRGELAAGQGDDFEQTDQRFNHLEFLARLRAALDLERPYLNAKATEAVELLIRRLRTHARIQLYLATGGLTPEEASLDASLEGLMTACTDAQTQIAKNSCPLFLKRFPSAGLRERAWMDSSKLWLERH